MKSIFIYMIKGYQKVFVQKPVCRFLPTCSEYSIEAIQTFGALRGIGMSFFRIMRCHPWGGHGYDPVNKGEKNV